MPSAETQQDHPPKNIFWEYVGTARGNTYAYRQLIEIRAGRLIIKVNKTHLLILANVTQIQNMRQPKM